jgi:hypothetical protein
MQLFWGVPARLVGVPPHASGHSNFDLTLSEAEFTVAFSAILNCVTIYVLAKTHGTVNRQAIAADRQAQAAEEQVVAARSYLTERY